MKYADKDDKLPDGTNITKGAAGYASVTGVSGDAIVYSPYAMGRDLRYWKDPEQFCPERWLSDSGFKDVSPFTFPAFNAGPRICLGKNLAYLEVKLFTTKLLDAFEFSQPEPHNGAYQNTLTFPLKNGLPMRVVPR